jgi:hypothetical protein
MPATQPSKELRALCYEHHAEMRLNQSLWFAKTLADFEINDIAAALPPPVLL